MSSRTPDGGYMPTFASNYMLDGFDFSEEYGEGPLMNRKMPNTSRTTGMAAPPRSESGMAKLPDGIVTNPRAAAVGDDLFMGVDGTDVGDLSGMVREAAHISDLSWLELAEQDPDRLPKQHNDKALQGLVEAWGTDKRTDGVEIIPNVVVPPPPRSQVALLPGDDTLRQVVASAMRKSAFGVPFQNIVADLGAHLGEALAHVHTDPRLQKLAASVRSIRAEHGIVGTVYLRDSAFPGLLTGKWDREIKKRCASAHYWLTRPGSKLAAYQNYLGKKVVTEIPWGEALSHYRPTLEVSGKRLASGDPKTVLVAALRAEATRANKDAHHTYHLTPAQRVSSEQAWKVFASAAPAKREILQKDTVRVSLEQARQRFASWVQNGLLTEESARSFLARNAPEEALRAGAHHIATTRKASKYAGHGIGAKTPERRTRNADWATEESEKIARATQERATKAAQDKVASVFRAWVKSGSLTQEQSDQILSRASGESALRLGQRQVSSNRAKQVGYAGQGVGATVFSTPVVRNSEWAEEVEAGLSRASLGRAATVLSQWVESGALTQKQADDILASNSSGEEALRVAAMARGVKTAKYKGQGVEKQVLSTRTSLKLSDARDPKVAQVIRYASAQMNEGAAGNDLDTLLNSRFSQEYLKGASEQLVQLRRKHEGLAGHVYIAADAYATPTGTTGCDKGALIHRANQVKAVLQMERCGSCAHNTEGHCQKYNKTLVTAAPVENPEKYQRETIRLANADDSERTAAMFNNYDPGEFDLQNDSLDTFDYDNLPDNKTLHGVLFEGMTLPEE